MSDMDDTPAGSPPHQQLHEEEADDKPKELGDYDVAAADDSDKDSDALSEIDEDQFDDYDPTAARIEEKPVEIDEDIARTLKAGKRKGQAVKKPKEGRREKKRARDQEDNDGADGEILSGKRVRKSAPAGSGKATPEPVNEEELTPAERRARAIERASRKETKQPSKRRKKKDEVDLEEELDEVIAELKMRMEHACRADNAAVEAGQSATHKLRLLPEVMALLNRNNHQTAVVDPDANFLQHVKFFLEPLNNGSMPAYSIQRDVFNALARLPIEKEALRASGIGKIVLFYTKSKKPELGIKRIAERLLGEWSRPILKRTDDYKKRQIETRDFDYHQAKRQQAAAGASQLTLTQRPAASQRDIERERILANPRQSTRAPPPGLPKSYTIAPRSTYDASRGPEHRPIGASGDAAFRKLANKGKKKA